MKLSHIIEWKTTPPYGYGLLDCIAEKENITPQQVYNEIIKLFNPPNPIPSGSGNYEYQKWVIKQWDKGNIQLPRDSERIKKALHTHYLIRNHLINTLGYPFIGQYRNLEMLEKHIQRFNER